MHLQEQESETKRELEQILERKKGLQMEVLRMTERAAKLQRKLLSIQEKIILLESPEEKKIRRLMYLTNATREQVVKAVELMSDE